MVVPTCNFYHFLVSFASRASPEDIHKERVRETEKKWGRERKTMESDVEREREQKKLRIQEEREAKRGREHTVIGEPT